MDQLVAVIDENGDALNTAAASSAAPGASSWHRALWTRMCGALNDGARLAAVREVLEKQWQALGTAGTFDNARRLEDNARRLEEIRADIRRLGAASLATPVSAAPHPLPPPPPPAVDISAELRLLHCSTAFAQLPPLFGLPKHQVAEQPPEQLSLWRCYAELLERRGGNGASSSLSAPTSRDILSGGSAVAFGELASLYAGLHVIVAAAGMGKTTLLRSIAHCHGAAQERLRAPAAAAAASAAAPSERGGVQGAQFTGFSRVIFLRLRALPRSVATAIDSGCGVSLGAAAVCAVEDAYVDVGARRGWLLAQRSAQSATALASDLFCAEEAAKTLWLIDVRFRMLLNTLPLPNFICYTCRVLMS